MEEPTQNPYAPPQAPPKEREEPNPYWGRTSLLDRFLYLDLRGKLRVWAITFLLFNLGSALLGYWWPVMTFVSVAVLLCSFLVGDSDD